MAFEQKKKGMEFMNNWLLDKIFKLKEDFEDLRQNKWFALLEFVFYIVVLILCGLFLYNYF